jgi:hypothetical protein
MKGLSQKILFFLFFLGIIFLAYPRPANALCDGGITGPKVAGNFADEWLDLIRNEYDARNPSCTGQRISITVLFVFDPNQPNQGPNWANDLSRINARNLRPIVRIAGSPSGGAWRRLDTFQAQSVALALNEAVQLSGVNDVIVYFGNEPNLPAEWGNYGATVDERLRDYTDSLDAFAFVANGSYDVFIAPLALHQSAGYHQEQAWIRDIILDCDDPTRGVCGEIDGAALTLYNTSAAALDADYVNMANFYASQGVHRIIASEVGAMVGTGPAQDTCYLAQWKQIMTNLFSQRTPLQTPGLLAGAEVVNTSFFEDTDCDGDPDWTHLVVIDEAGNVEVGLEFNGQFITLEDQLAAEGRSYRLTVCCTQVPDDDDGGPNHLPGDQPTEWGQSVFGSDIHCKTELGSSEVSPFDRSPWRPFPAESSRNHNCYNLESLEAEGKITVYCNPAPQPSDIIQWFPIPQWNYSDPLGNTYPNYNIEQTFLILGELKTWWFDNTRATQIPFLGNSQTSIRRFTDNSERMSFFLTDFLRGTAYFDQQRIRRTNWSEYRRIADESGPIRKLYPHEWLSGSLANQRKRQFIGCRLGSSTTCDQLTTTDPIHDYALEWNGSARRLSDITRASRPRLWNYHFPLTSKEDAPAFVDLGVTTVWPSPPYAPDPAIFHPATPTEPSVPSSVPMSDIYTAIDDYNGFYYVPLVDSSGNPRTSPRTITASGGMALPLFEVHFVERVYLPYIPESKELAEWAGAPLTPLAYQDPASSQFWERDGSLNTLSLDNPFSQILNCNVNDLARGGLGDSIGADAVQNDWLYFYSDWHDQANVPATEWGCFTAWDVGGNQRVHQAPGIGYDQPGDPNFDSSRFPTRLTAFRQRNLWNEPEAPYAWVTTKIPYLEDIARRTIGRAGLFRSLMPRQFSEDVIDLIKDVAGGRIHWYELPGYGPAYYTYTNQLVEEDREEHWGECDEYRGDICSVSGAGAFCPSGCPSGLSPSGAVDPSTFCGGPSGECIMQRTWCCLPGTTPPDPSCVQTDITYRHCATDTPGATCSCNADECRVDETRIPPGQPCWCGCPDDNNSQCGPAVGQPTSDGTSGTTHDHLSRGWEEINDSEARFYYPYIGTIDLFRQYLHNQTNPALLSNFGPPTTTRPPGGGTPLPTPTPGGLGYTLPFRDSADPLDSNFINSAVARMINMTWTSHLFDSSCSANTSDPAYCRGAAPGTRVRDYIISQAQLNGWSPVFILALWMEETGASHFLFPIPPSLDPPSLDALGCAPHAVPTPPTLIQQRKNISESLDCLFFDPRFSAFTNSEFEDFMCLYSENATAPCTFTLNPFFVGNIHFYYNLIAGNPVP